MSESAYFWAEKGYAGITNEYLNFAGDLSNKEKRIILANAYEKSAQINEEFAENIEDLFSSCQRKKDEAKNDLKEAARLRAEVADGWWD